MASLANQTISSTYDGLIKTSSDNAVPVSGVQALEDGSGNALALSVGRSGNGVTVSGNLAVDTNTLYVDAANNRVGIGVVPDFPLHIKSSTDIVQYESTTNGLYNQYKSTAGIFGYVGSGSQTVSGGGTTDFGIQSPLGSILFATGGNTEIMRIDASGNVGIGTSPDEILHIRAANAPTLRIESGDTSGATGEVIGKVDFWGNDFSGTGRDSRGYVASVYEDAFARAALVFASGPYNATSTERMRITSGGDVLFGTQGIPNGTSVYGAGFQNASAERSILYTATNITSSAALMYFANPNGFVGNITVNGSTTSFNSTSDYRLKENVVEMTGALDRVDALKPSRFNYILDPEKTVDGFLAHEVQAVVPEAVTGEKDAVDEEGNPIYQGIDQSKIVPLLVGAIKELRAEIELLKSQLNA